MFRISIIVLLSLSFAGCSLRSRPAPEDDLDKASALFFERYKAADYDAIYKDSAAGFKQNKGRDEVVGNLKQLAELGRLADYQRIRTSFEDQDKARIASPAYSVQFEQGRGELTLNFTDEDGEWKLIGFAFRRRS
jgi:hypothetical protein